MIEWVKDFFRRKNVRLFHPESPGVWVQVKRSRFEGLFKPSDFATLGECLQSWRDGSAAKSRRIWNPFGSNYDVIYQRTFIYCGCGHELIGDGRSFRGESYDECGDNHVYFTCVNCGRKHEYNFDIAPVPVNWEDLR